MTKHMLVPATHMWWFADYFLVLGGWLEAIKQYGHFVIFYKPSVLICNENNC